METLLILLGSKLIEDFLKEDKDEDLHPSIKTLIANGLGITINTIAELFSFCESSSQVPMDNRNLCVVDKSVRCTFTGRNAGGLCFLHTGGVEPYEVDFLAYEKCKFRN